jgi:hypothetical protein
MLSIRKARVITPCLYRTETALEVVIRNMQSTIEGIPSRLDAKHHLPATAQWLHSG